MADANPFRFSTKYCDSELAPGPADDLYYYGYRFYSPRLGRWLSRDPIEENGGLNLYRFVRNRPISRLDPTGRKDCGPWKDAGIVVGVKPRELTEFVTSQRRIELFRGEDASFQVIGWLGFKIVLIGPGEGGKGEDAEIDLGAWPYWHFPSLQDILTGSAEIGGEPALKAGAPCRKYVQCIRKCTRCCSTPKKGLGDGFVGVDEFNEDKYLYGTIMWDNVGQSPIS